MKTVLSQPYVGACVLLFLSLSIMFSSCKRESSGDDARMLWGAICKMDISANERNTKSATTDIIGDSIAVHRLACYAAEIECTVDSSWEMGPIEYQAAILADDTPFFERDTVNHTFSFSNDAVIMYQPYVDENGYGMPGHERIGWLICYNNSVFVAYYDTVSGRYHNPVLEPDSFGYHHHWRHDTLGYIPNKIAKANRTRLIQLLEEKRFSEMLEVFKSDYHIYTCTGEEYRELVRLGIN